MFNIHKLREQIQSLKKGTSEPITINVMPTHEEEPNTNKGLNFKINAE